MARGRNGNLYVIGQEFCNPKTSELYVPGKVVMPAKPDHDTAYVVAGETKTMFTVKNTTSACGMHDKRVIYCRLRPGAPILTLRHKVRSVHHRWQVFKGSSEDEDDLLFSVKKTKMMSSNGDLDVFLAENKDEKICDYKVQIYSDKFDVYYISESRVIAEIGECEVKVYSKIDRAFIISLLTIVNGINHQRSKREVTKDMLQKIGVGVGVVASALGLLQNVI